MKAVLALVTLLRRLRELRIQRLAEDFGPRPVAGGLLDLVPITERMLQGLHPNLAPHLGIRLKPGRHVAQTLDVRAQLGT